MTQMKLFHEMNVTLKLSILLDIILQITGSHYCPNAGKIIAGLSVCLFSNFLLLIKQQLSLQ